MDTHPLYDGAVAGVRATAAMSAAMGVAQKAGLMGKQPPKKITESMLERLEMDTGEVGTNAASSVAHLAFGVAAGALFAAGRSLIGQRGPALVEGVTFGILLWALSYKGWIPRLGLMQPPERDRPGRPASMIAAHAIYGAVLGRALERREPAPR